MAGAARCSGGLDMYEGGLTVPDLMFGVNVSTAAAADADPVGDARFAEDIGFDFVSANDHPGGSGPNYETWTMLSWIAAATTRVQLATRVLGVPLRPPAVLAKMGETFDRLSGGRLILGLGAGGSDEELRSFGAPAATPGERIDGLVDAVHIMRGLWAGPSFTHSGTVYSTIAAELEPKPERPIPIWLGTFGPRALGVTGRLADGWIPTLGFVSAEQLRPMCERVFAAARNAGRDPDDIACVLNLEIGISGFYEPDPEDPDVVTGSPEQIAEQLLSFVEMGFTGFNIDPAGHSSQEQLRCIATEILPALRATV